VKGRSRSRCWTTPVSSNTVSTSSNGMTCVNSPRWPGAKTPDATVMVQVMSVVADWGDNETSTRELILADRQ
jgi:hypothetical protein